jgi:hypothetical protein
MGLKLDLSLDGLGFQNLSFSGPHPRLPSRVRRGAGSDSIRSVWAVPPMAAEPPDPAEFDLVARGTEWRWEVKSNSSQSVASFGSCPSTAPPLSDLPLTPIPELLHTPTKRRTRISAGAPTTSPSPAQPAELQQHLSVLPSPLDSGPILDQLAQGEKDISTIQKVRVLIQE